MVCILIYKCLQFYRPDKILKTFKRTSIKNVSNVNS